MATKAAERDESKPDWWLAKIFLQYHFSQQPLTRNKLAAPLEKMLNDVRTSTEAATIERCAKIAESSQKTVPLFGMTGTEREAGFDEACKSVAAAIRSMGDAK